MHDPAVLSSHFLPSLSPRLLFITSPKVVSTILPYDPTRYFRGLTLICLCHFYLAVPLLNTLSQANSIDLLGSCLLLSFLKWSYR
jgi:hypothetical protein